MKKLVMLGASLFLAGQAFCWVWPGDATRQPPPNSHVYVCEPNIWSQCFRSLDPTDASASVGDEVVIIIGGRELGGVIAQKGTNSSTVNMAEPVEENTTIKVQRIAD